MTPARAQALRERLQREPQFFIGQILGHELWSKPAEIVEAVRSHPSVAVRSCHASSKTFTAADLVLWWVYSFPRALVLTLAPSYRQVKGNLWHQIHLAHAGAKVPLGGELQHKSCRLEVPSHASVAMGFSTDQMERLHGWHADYVLLVVDEASGVDEPFYQALEGIRASGRIVRVLLLSQGTRVTGTFYEAFHRQAERWCGITISARDTPNFQPEVLRAWEDAGRPDDWPWPKPYLINPAWAWDLERKYGRDSDLYRVRVLGEFPSGEDTALIPLWMVDAALARELPPPTDPQTWAGLDVARFGDDDSVIIVRRGPVVLHSEVRHGHDTLQVADWALEVVRRFGVTDLNVDVIGVGGGVVDVLKARDPACRVHAVNVGEAAQDTERFVNRRAEIFWGLRERFQAGDISLASLPRDLQQRLTAELTGLRLLPPSPRGAMRLEPKEAFRGRLGHSPDVADALALAYAQPGDSVAVFYAGGLADSLVDFLASDDW